MSKVLAISDIHIHDYPQRNPSEKYRLYQSRVVAKNIIDVAKSEGAEIVVIAGDVVEKPVNRPYVLAEVKLFLDTIMSYFKEGYIIWGNHDQDNKGVDQDFIDSALSVMLPGNLKYADKQIIELDGSTIAFSNWQPEFDLSWIQKPVDILFTHATICYSDSGSEYFKSQTLDESKFGLAICGDIHKPGSIGKYVSIGIPQRCKMSDSEYSTGVILDCSNKSWKWVNLNPADNLMKFEYTSSQSEEGWDGSTGTWKVYKPETLGVKDGIRDVEIPAWEEVSHLVDSVISASGLTEVHQEVLKEVKDLDAHGVDFNFTITRFYCKNWRSIDEVELYFDNYDKILISGKNGSGKSSLLSALRYAFVENKFIKDFTQFGAKECYTEVEFIYQGNNYKLGRGSHKYGLWVNGEQMKYNNKTMFNEDVRERFPFIGYMDIFFFDSDHHKLIGDMTPERKSEIIFKFFKLDRIDTLNEVSSGMLEKYSKELRSIESEVSSSKNLLKFIDQKIDNLQVSELGREDAMRLKQEGLEIKKAADIWLEYEDKLRRVETNLEINTKNVQSLKADLAKKPSPETLNLEIKDLEAQVEENEAQIKDITSINIEIQGVTDRVNQINKEGSKLYQDWGNADSLKTCSKCGQPIKNPETVDRYKQELETRMNELMNEKGQLEVRYKALVDQKVKAEPMNLSVRRIIKDLRSKILEKSTELNLINDLTGRIQEVERNNEKWMIELEGLRKSCPQKVTLPENFIEKMTDLERIISVWDEYYSLLSDKRSEENKIAGLEDSYTKIKSSMESLSQYNKLTGPTGKIFEEIMTRLAEQFSDNQVKYEVNTYSFRKTDHLDLTSSFNNNGNYVSYQACSSGQKTILDINFLSKIVTRLGLLVMDEFLKHLDPMNHDNCIELISSMNIGCILISSHMESITTFNNKSCNLELNDSGVTKITLQ